MHDLLDRRVHETAVQHRRVMAAAAPLRGLGANRVLHVLDRLAIPLVVERRKMMRGAEPLVIDIFVAAFTGVRLHEELAGNLLSAVNLGGTGEKWAVRTVPFAVHAGRRSERILNASTILPARSAEVPGSPSDGGKHSQAGCRSS